MVSTDTLMATQTYKWLVSVNGDRSVGIKKITYLIENSQRLGAQHMGNIILTPVSGILQLDASIKAIALLQLQSWVMSVSPHSSQFASYEMSIVESMDRKKLLKQVKRLRARMLECMLEKDVIKITLKSRTIFVVCTERGRNFLSEVPFLGFPKKIE